MLCAFPSTAHAAAGIMELLSSGAYYLGGGSSCSQPDARKAEAELAKSETFCGGRPVQVLPQAGMLAELQTIFADHLQDDYFKTLGLEYVPELKCSASFSTDASKNPAILDDLEMKFNKLREFQQALKAKITRTPQHMFIQVCPLSVDLLEHASPAQKADCTERIKLHTAYEEVLSTIPLANTPYVKKLIDAYSNSPTANPAKLRASIATEYRLTAGYLTGQASNLTQLIDTKGGAGLDRGVRRMLMSDPALVQRLIERGGNAPDIKELSCQMNAQYGSGANSLDTDLFVGSLLFAGGEGVAEGVGIVGQKLITGASAARAFGAVSSGAARVMQVGAFALSGVSAYDQALKAKSCFTIQQISYSATAKDQCVSAPSEQELAQGNCVLNAALAALNLAIPAGIIAKEFKLARAAATADRGVATAAVALTDETRASAAASLRAKGINDSNYKNFFDWNNLKKLTDPERLYLFERYAGRPLSDAEAKELLSIHQIGGNKGYGQYTMVELLQKARRLKALLKQMGITDPNQMSGIINLAIRNGIAGTVSENEQKQTLLKKIQDLVGVGPKARQAKVDISFAERVAAGKAHYAATGQEVLDVDRQSSSSRLAQQINAGDTFGQDGVFHGNLDELLTSGAYANDGQYSSIGGRSRWWQDASLTGKESGSPISQLSDDPSQVERKVFWARDQLEANKSRELSYETDFTRLGIANNYVGGSLHSVESIARRQDGSLAFFYYVKGPEGKLVPALTFKGEPIPDACIKCHQHPSNPGVATQIPYVALRARGLDGTSSTYAAAAAKIIEQENLPPLIPSRVPYPNTVQPALRELSAANSASLRTPQQQKIATQNAARIGNDLDRQRNYVERILGRQLDIRADRPLNQALRKANDLNLTRSGKSPDQVRADLWSVLRYGMTRAELQAYRSANGQFPPEVFSAEIADRILRDGVFGL